MDIFEIQYKVRQVSRYGLIVSISHDFHARYLDTNTKSLKIDNESLSSSSDIMNSSAQIKAFKLFELLNAMFTANMLAIFFLIVLLPKIYLIPI